MGGGKDGRWGEVVKRTLKRPLPSSEPELWATGKRKSRRDSRTSLGEKQEDAASTLEWTAKVRRRESGPGVCSGPTALMMAAMGMVGGGRFPTPTPRVSAEEAEKWPCTWAGGTLERTRSLEPKRLGVASLHGSGEGREEKQYFIGSRQKQRLMKGGREGAIGWMLEGKPAGGKVRERAGAQGP